MISGNSLIGLICLVASASTGQAALAAGVSVREVQDFVFGGYQGEFVSPPSADGNPRRAIVVEWAGRPWRLVFWHEASYCPFFELSDGSGVCVPVLRRQRRLGRAVQSIRADGKELVCRAH